MLRFKRKIIFAASLIILGACSNMNHKQNNNSLNKDKTNIIQSNIENTRENITTPNSQNEHNSNSVVKKIRGEYKLPNNTPAFIADFIKNNPEIGQPDKIAELLMQQTSNEQVIKLISPASQPLRKNWLVYRSKFVEPMRIKAGVNFWKENSALLKKIEEEFKVDAHIIVGIIGVDSIFGRNMGNFDVLNTLYTLSFYYPNTPNKKEREQMFQKQLASYIVWNQSNNSDNSNIAINSSNYNHTGSFAGAMGMPQFMPISIQKYAIDYDKDGIINLSSSIPDVLASVANFLKQHGWKAGEKVILDVNKTPENIALLKANATGKPKPALTFKDLPSLNFNYTNYGLSADTKILVVDLPSGSDIEYKIGLENFYVLTRYNQSFFYALSVYELGNSMGSMSLVNSSN